MRIFQRNQCCGPIFERITWIGTGPEVCHDQSVVTDRPCAHDQPRAARTVRRPGEYCTCQCPASACALARYRHVLPDHESVSKSVQPNFKPAVPASFPPKIPSRVHACLHLSFSVRRRRCLIQTVTLTSWVRLSLCLNLISKLRFTVTDSTCFCTLRAPSCPCLPDTFVKFCEFVTVTSSVFQEVHNTFTHTLNKLFVDFLNLESKESKEIVVVRCLLCARGTGRRSREKK